MSSSWADALLVVVLLAPLAAVILAVAAAVPSDDQRWTTGACVLASAGAIVLLVTGQHPQVNRLAPDELALAAAAATALLAVGLPRASRTPVVASVVMVVTCGLAAGAPGEPSTVGPVLALGAAIALLTTTHSIGRLTTAAVCAGVVAAAAGVRSGGHSGAVAVILGVALVATAAGFSPRRPVTLLTPLALVLGLHVSDQLVGTSTARWLAVVLGGAGALLALAPYVAPRSATPSWCVALVPWTLAAAVGPLAGTPSAARALGAGAVLALLLGGPLAVLAAAPGAAVLVYALADGRGWPRPVLGVLASATVLGLSAARADTTRGRARAVDWVAGVAGVWLVLRPTSWTWARVGGLRAYTDGTALAAAVALIAGVAMAASGTSLAVESLTPWVVVRADDEDVPVPAARGEVIVVTAAVLTGLLAAALVRSARL